MKPIRILMLFISWSVIASCEKDENVNIKVELIGSGSFEIVNSEFDVYVWGYDPNFQDVPATLITHKKFNATQIPCKLNIEIPENAPDRIENITHKKDATFYLYVTWDSDGNGQICDGDLAIDFNAKFPHIFINETETQIINLKTLNSVRCN